MDLEKAKMILKIKDESPERLLELCEAFWVYKGKPGEPHAILTSGLHSDGYINLNLALKFPNVCEISAKKLIQKLEEEGVSTTEIDVIVSSSFGAIVFGYEMARQLRKISVFTEKEGDIQKWSGRFGEIKGATILQVEEVVTTLRTTRLVKQAILKENPNVKFLEINGKTVVACIVHRPHHLPIHYPDYIVISLIKKEIHSWKPPECPLCKIGSEPLEPKQNWQRFIEHR